MYPMQNNQSVGSCLCGSITFTLKYPTKWVLHCHCSRCQRAHGSAFVTWVGAETGQVEIVDSKNRLCWYSEPTGSSRGFCNNCGSPMFFRSKVWTDETHIARALFTQPLDREPGSHVHYDTHVDWVSVADSLPVEPDVR
ncbi:GFA family protein [Rhodoferax sp. GW822-FHT02A01]|uniref:GFA family protein n=1 Tax=Rhodoferax sp. GW822-FHT02A01 TaxID=3141537 RepID=UPI00315D1D30